jgi:hypothetical protein
MQLKEIKDFMRTPGKFDPLITNGTPKEIFNFIEEVINTEDNVLADLKDITEEDVENLAKEHGDKVYLSSFGNLSNANKPDSKDASGFSHN